MVEAGLYKKKDEKCRPEPQLCGLGRTNKKDAAGNFIWDWTNPILMPYFDKHGEVLAIRPHKGGVAGQPARSDNLSSLHTPSSFRYAIRLLPRKTCLECKVGNSSGFFIFPLLARRLSDSGAGDG
jgi:hypothetical protein